MPHEEDYTFRLHDRVRSRYRTCIVIARFHNSAGVPLYVVESADIELLLHITSSADLVHVGPLQEQLRRLAAQNVLVPSADLITLLDYINFLENEIDYWKGMS